MVNPKRHREGVNQRLIVLTSEFSTASAKLIQMWANCESWFPHILSILLRTDIERARLVFSTLTSTRARIDLVRRAGIMCLPHNRDIRHLQKLCQEFDHVTKKRNLICHAEYGIGPRQESITDLMSTNYQRSDFNGTNQFEFRRIDRGFVNEITQATKSAMSLCVRLERFKKRHEAHVLVLPRSQPAKYFQTQKSKRKSRR